MGEYMGNKDREGICERLNREVKRQETWMYALWRISQSKAEDKIADGEETCSPNSRAHCHNPENRALPTNATNHSCRVPGPMYTGTQNGTTTLTNKLLIISSLCVACYT